MELDKTQGVNFSAILTSPVAEERRKEGRHDADVENVTCRHQSRPDNRRTTITNLTCTVSKVVFCLVFYLEQRFRN